MGHSCLAMILLKKAGENRITRIADCKLLSRKNGERVAEAMMREASSLESALGEKNWYICHWKEVILF